MTLHDALRNRLRLSDEAFAARCGGVLRGQIHGFRTGRRIPRADTAAAILSALKKLGVEMTLAELLSKPSPQRRARASA
jgi:transcriptional regulator with XRE-family HTH domain